MSFPAAESAAMFLVGGGAVSLGLGGPVGNQQQRPPAAENDDDDEEEEYDGREVWKNASQVAREFFDWTHEEVHDTTSVDRDTVHKLFVSFLKKNETKQQQHQQQQSDDNTFKRSLESLVMASLRSQKLMKTKRYNDGVVVCHFACKDGDSFPPIQERITARDKLKQQYQLLLADKNGISITNEHTKPSQKILPTNTLSSVAYEIDNIDELQLQLLDVQLSGPHKDLVTIDQETLPLNIDSHTTTLFQFYVQTKTTGVIRVNLLFQFGSSSNQGQPKFSILRSMCLQVCNDSELYEMLQPTTLYVKKKRKKEFMAPQNKGNILHPPPPEGAGGKNKNKKGVKASTSTQFQYKRLKQFKVPVDIREMVTSGEVDNTNKDYSIIEKPTYDGPIDVYRTFWQRMLWVSELQAYKDIQLFDMENAQLQKHGRYVKLHVPGLAEGRPSILRGDVVICFWRKKEYRGRVLSVELLNLVLEFHRSFHGEFNCNLDRVDLVRFTFSRTTFRTSHQGCSLAIKNMGPPLLMPSLQSKIQIQNLGATSPRAVPNQFAWASRTLNEEQRDAVTEIANATLRPMPYIIFGPPGTGYVFFKINLI
jgi:hypothetical protein